MHIAVDCHVMDGKFQGSRTYIHRLYQEILKLAPRNYYHFLGHWGGDRPFGENVPHLEYKSRSRLKRLTYQSYSLLHQYDIDLLHSTFISPLLAPCRHLVTVHDILFETHPQFFERSLVLRNRILVRRSARKAAQVHTISTCTKQNLIERYGLSSDLIHLVPVGVDLNRFTPDGRDEARARIHKEFGTKDFILTVGRLEPRKNHVGLLEAYSALRQRMSDIPQLVIVGQRDFDFDGVFETITLCKLENSVRVLSNIDDDTLPRLYRSAMLFVYPSFAEGFGIPPLEAMASGTPVVTSNTTAIPEVVGDAGLLVNPDSVEQIAHAMDQVLTDSVLAADLAIRGRRRAEMWSWESAARKYIDGIEALR